MRAMPKAPRTMTQTALLRTVAPVFANPSDPALRQVVGDALLEHEHPWGELIALQRAIAGGQGTTPLKRRAAELLKSEVSTLLGPIAKIVSSPVKNLRFEHGFLTDVSLHKRLIPRPDWQAAARAPHWATVRRVYFSILTTPQWWLTPWAENPASTRSLERIEVTTLKIVRDREHACWRVIRATRKGDANYLVAFARGLSRDERARLEVSPNLAPKDRKALEALEALEAALAHAGLK